MGSRNLFHFNIEVRLPSSMVIGSRTYYHIWMLISSSTQIQEI
jgi:hypothetical protein